MHKLIIAAAAIILFGSLFLILHFFGKGTHKTNRYTHTRRKSTDKEPYLEPQQAEAVSHSANINSNIIENDSHEDDTDSDAILGLKKQNSNEIKMEPVSENKSVNKNSNFSRIIILHLMAPKDRPFVGYELLQSLLANGLRYGKMNIFHRHEHKTGRGAILFSLASAEKPGTFDLPKMGAFSCPGLTLFLSITKVEDPLGAFDIMLETIGQLLEDLGGKVLDEQFEALTKEKVVLVRKKIRDYLQAPQAADLFEEISQVP